VQNDWEYHFDPESKVPYLYSDQKQEFISYDDDTSISYKAHFVMENDYGGVMIWDLSSDRSADLLQVIVSQFKTCKKP
jgi:chitinase